MACVSVLAMSAGAHASVRDRASMAGLLPHKALYDIRLTARKNGAQISNISGQMMYEWQPDCDAWVSNTQFNLLYEYLESPAMQVTSDFSTYEAFDGQEMSFSVQRKREGQVFQEFRGLASGGAQEKLQRAVYSVPEGLSKDLPQGTLFPIAHTLGVIQAIQEGRKFFSAPLFDGSDEEGASLVNTFIGKPVDVAPYKKQKDGYDNAMLGDKAWHLRLAFFPITTEEQAAAEYEMSAVFHETGVISHMNVDYSNFSIEQALVAVEPRAQICQADGKKKEKAKDNPDKAE